MKTTLYLRKKTRDYVFYNNLNNKFPITIIFGARTADRTASQQCTQLAIVAKIQLFSKYWTINVLESPVWPFGSRGVRHMTIRFGIGHFLLVVLWGKPPGFRDIQWRVWRCGWHDHDL